jgi:hypothetical protein
MQTILRLKLYISLPRCKLQRWSVWHLQSKSNKRENVNNPNSNKFFEYAEYIRQKPIYRIQINFGIKQ